MSGVTSQTVQQTPSLQAQGLFKSYGAVEALADVSFSLHSGQVLGVLGDNGAGKTTLVKCLAGLHKPDEGAILIHGTEGRISSPQDARAAGIETVHQNLALVPHLNVAANMFLNRELTFGFYPLRLVGWMNKRQMYRETRKILDRLHVSIPSVRQRLDELSGGQRQAIAVSRAVEWSRDIVLLDEPTAALGVEQSKAILDLIRKLSDEGVAVLMVTHNMQHVVEVCHRAIVLRHGRKVGDVEVSDVSAPDLVDLITGAQRLSRDGSSDLGSSEEQS
jgi:simple sugar transport system ATP-binding protein